VLGDNYLGGLYRRVGGVAWRPTCCAGFCITGTRRPVAAKKASSSTGSVTPAQPLAIFLVPDFCQRCRSPGVRYGGLGRRRRATALGCCCCSARAARPRSGRCSPGCSTHGGPTPVSALIPPPPCVTAGWTCSSSQPGSSRSRPPHGFSVALVGTVTLLFAASSPAPRTTQESLAGSTIADRLHFLGARPRAGRSVFAIALLLAPVSRARGRGAGGGDDAVVVAALRASAARLASLSHSTHTEHERLRCLTFEAQGFEVLNVDASRWRRRRATRESTSRSRTVFPFATRGLPAPGRTRCSAAACAPSGVRLLERRTVTPVVTPTRPRLCRWAPSP